MTLPICSTQQSSPRNSASQELPIQTESESPLILISGKREMSVPGHKRTNRRRPKSTVVRFSNRPFGVKHFQTVHYCSVDVAHGLALLFGIGTKALPSWDSRTRRNNLLRGLTVRLTIGPSGQANSPHPSSREGHLSTA